MPKAEDLYNTISVKNQFVENQKANEVAIKSGGLTEDLKWKRFTLTDWSFFYNLHRLWIQVKII